MAENSDDLSALAEAFENHFELTLNHEPVSDSDTDFDISDSGDDPGVDSPGNVRSLWLRRYAPRFGFELVGFTDNPPRPGRLRRNEDLKRLTQERLAKLSGANDYDARHVSEPVELSPDPAPPAEDADDGSDDSEVSEQDDNDSS